jgi:hypothetical protein
MPQRTDQALPRELQCSFCAKSQRFVAKLVAGPNGQICNECIDICADIIAEDRKDASEPGSAVTPPDRPDGYVSSPIGHVVVSCALCRMPTPLEHALSVGHRGALCPGCVGAVEAAVAVAREHETDVTAG